MMALNVRLGQTGNNIHDRNFARYSHRYQFTWVPVNSSHSELVTRDEFTVALLRACDEFTV